MSVRETWVEQWDGIAQRWEGDKMPMGAVFELADAYKSLSADERAIADEVIAERAENGDPPTRFDALHLIREFHITSALPALRRLQARLETQTDPPVRSEWAKVNRIIGSLVEGQASS